MPWPLASKPIEWLLPTAAGLASREVVYEGSPESALSGAVGEAKRDSGGGPRRGAIVLSVKVGLRHLPTLRGETR